MDFSGQAKVLIKNLNEKERDNRIDISGRMTSHPKETTDAMSGLI
jgi:hypothetical protein